MRNPGGNSMTIFDQLLQSSRLKVTAARKTSLHFLEKEGRPVDVEEILEHLRQHHLETDRATVYRMIESFLEKGIINRFEFGEGKFRYELAGSDHHHLICEECGRIEDISDCGIEQWEKLIKKRKGFLIKRHALEFFGICKSCQH